MYLSYSGYKVARSCLKQYMFSYIKKAPPARPDDRLGSIYGSAIGRIFEVFYRDELWRQADTGKVLEAMAEKTVAEVIADEQKPKWGRPGGVLLWKDKDDERWGYTCPEEIVEDIKASIPKGLTTIKKNILLSHKAQAELKLDSNVEGHRLGGRADFVFTRAAHKDTVIVDGKGSRKRDRYVDPDQLKWYAMLFREQNGCLPDRTAFLYWRFEPPVSLDWYEFSEAEVEEFKALVLGTIQEIENLQSAAKLEVVEAFESTANTNNCRFCPYASNSLCPEGFEVVQELERKRRASA